MADPGKTVAWLVREVLKFNRGEQMLFLKALLTSLSEKERLQWFQWVCPVVYSGSDWIKLDRWMERRLKKDPHQTPRQLASTCERYHKIPPRMLSFLTRMAQRVKHRMLTRRRRNPR